MLIDLGCLRNAGAVHIRTFKNHIIILIDIGKHLGKI
jgi:hypothetical protein